VAKLRKLPWRKSRREELKEKSIDERVVRADRPPGKSSGFMVSATTEQSEAGGVVGRDVYVKLVKVKEMESV
jgi:hypothetical protein